MQHKQCMRPHGRGFTLVELSIVLVILGLLVGGVLTGQSLIRAAELRAVTTEHQRYITAVHTFRDKYFALPGDMPNAASFWTTLSAGNNGNGDGRIDNASAASVTGEIFQLWNELALAGLIEGRYSGLSGGGSAYDTVPGTNSPRSKMSNSGWGLSCSPSYGGDSWAYAADFSNYLAFGTTYPATLPFSPSLKPEEAWNIDTNMDDGKPGTGRQLARETVTWAAAAGTKCTTSSGATDYAGNYNLSNSTMSCSLMFPRSF